MTRRPGIGVASAELRRITSVMIESPYNNAPRPDGLDSLSPGGSLIMTDNSITAGGDTSTEGVSSAPYFAVSPLKLVVMSFCTFTLYQIYWFYKNWWLVKERERSNINPAMRSVFAYFFCYSLFSKLRDTAQENHVAVTLPAGPLAALWIVVTLLSILPDPYWLVSSAAILSSCRFRALRIKSTPMWLPLMIGIPVSPEGTSLRLLSEDFCSYSPLSALFCRRSEAAVAESRPRAAGRTGTSQPLLVDGLYE